MLAADAPTTDGSESLAKDTSRIVAPSQDRKPFQSTDPEPEPHELRDIMNPPQAPKLVNEKAKRDGRLLKIVLDGKRPITEAGDPTERVPRYDCGNDGRPKGELPVAVVLIGWRRIQLSIEPGAN